MCENEALPIMRRDIILPAIVTVLPSYASKFALTEALSASTGYFTCSYGFLPSPCNFASFSRRMRACSASVSAVCSGAAAGACPFAFCLFSSIGFYLVFTSCRARVFVCAFAGGRSAIYFFASEISLMTSTYDSPPSGRTVTRSPTFAPMSAAPTGETLEILFSRIFDSVVPVIS